MEEHRELLKELHLIAFLVVVYETHKRKQLVLRPWHCLVADEVVVSAADPLQELLRVDYLQEARADRRRLPTLQRREKALELGKWAAEHNPNNIRVVLDSPLDG